MPKKRFVLHGEVMGVDVAAKTSTVKGTLKSGQTREFTFTVGDKTEVTICGTAGKLGEVKTGDSVRVSYTKSGTSRLAEEVAVAEAPAKKT